MIGLALLLVAGAAQSEPAISVKAVPGKGYAATVTLFPMDQAAAVQTRLDAAAAQRCGKLTVRWGKFSYDTQFGTGENSARTYAADYRQAFSCIDPATDPYKPVPADWKATPTDDADAIAFAKRYLAVFDAADAPRGIPMMEPLLELDAKTWNEQPLALKAVRGTGSRTLSGPYWQANPSGAGHPGAYATFTFKGVYSGLSAHCGYIVLYRDAPGFYYVSQQNIRAIAKADNASAEAIASACKDF